MTMYGQITKFRRELGTGVIRAEDGRKFRFATAELMNRSDELVGHGVDFLLADRQPRKIVVLTGSPWTAFGSITRH
jgi:hypothetical protein